MKKKDTQALLLIVVVAVAVLATWFVMNNLPQSMSSGVVTPNVQRIKNVSGLDAVTQNLDATNLDQMDAGNAQVAADAVSF